MEEKLKKGKKLHDVGALAIHSYDDKMMEPGERLVTIIRKHPIGLVGIYLELALGTFAVLAMIYFVIYGFFSDGTSATKGLFAVTTLFILGFLAIILVAAVYVYRKSHLIVTDKGIVEVMQNAPFNRRIARLSMANVEDVNVEQRGVLASMFNYGKLTIQTAGQEDNFVFSMCPNPDYYANQIIETRQQYVRIYGDERRRRG